MKKTNKNYWWKLNSIQPNTTFNVNLLFSSIYVSFFFYVVVFILNHSIIYPCVRFNRMKSGETEPSTVCTMNIQIECETGEERTSVMYFVLPFVCALVYVCIVTSLLAYSFCSFFTWFALDLYVHNTNGW